MGRAPFAGAVSQRGFAAFVTSAPIVILRIGGKYRLRFSPAVSSYFASVYAAGCRVGVFDRTQVATPRWLLGHLAPLLGADRTDEAPDGYYLFRDGVPVAYHPGAYDLTLARTVLAAAKPDHLDARSAGAVIDAFETALRRPPFDTLRTEPAGEGGPPPPPAEMVPVSLDPYQILGVTPSATDAEVKAAWRKAMKLNHPDRVAHLSETIQAVAKRETQAADDAYNAIKRLRAGAADE
jgi:hypothetical protein